MEKFLKAPIVYQGNKYGLLKKIAPFFPKNINEKILVDVFGGSSVMSLNFGEKAIYNEFNQFICSLIKMIYTNKQYMLDMSNKWTEEYNLSWPLDTEENQNIFKENFNKFRDYVNSLEFESDEHIAGVYTLHIYSINNLLRFNKSGKFNASAGFRGSQKNNNKINNFIVPNKELIFVNKDFEELLEMIEASVDAGHSSPENYFLYLDPPYLNTTAVYNENRLTGWDINDDYRLFKKLDELSAKGFKWAFSNTFVGKHGVENTHLIEWSKKYNVNYLDHNYTVFGQQNRKNVEVLITNYEGGE